MSFHRGTLNDRDKTFLAHLGRAIRDGGLGFARGGRYIDRRFSLGGRLSLDGKNGDGNNGSNRATPVGRGTSLQSPQERLVAALRWAIEPTAGALEEERQAICLLAWLVSDETAHLLHTILCDFQMIPWRAAAGDGHGRDLSHAARSLWGSREAAALEAFDLRLIQAARRSAQDLGVGPLS